MAKISNADGIMSEISDMLDRSMLKNSKITREEIITFIEQKWAEADDEKYRIYGSYIYAARMVNEYKRSKDYANMKRWLDEMDRHQRNNHPDFINNYFKGECALECGNEQVALEFLQKSYDEDRDYLFTRGPKCAEFFNSHLVNPRILPSYNEKKSDDFYISLCEFARFFDQDSKFRCILFDKDKQELPDPSSMQSKAIEFLEANESEILQTILDEILKLYPHWQEIYGYEGEYKSDFMPDIGQAHELASLLTLTNIFVLEDDERTRIGFGFNCSWDSEHGLGVMTCDGKILDIGGAEMAFC